MPAPIATQKKLTSTQWGRLSAALQSGFPSPFDLQILLQEELGLNLSFVSSLLKQLPFIVYDIIQHTEARNLTLQLLDAARRNRPAEPEFIALAQELGAAPPTTALEAILNDQNIVFDAAALRRRISDLERQVCRVDLKGKAQGTGFLVGQQTVITNYHVVRKVIEQQPGFTPADISLRFDYKLLDDGTTIYPGTVYNLAQDWLIDSSGYSPVDLQGEPKPVDPKADELDYAVLRVDGTPAADNPGKLGQMNPVYGATRGHVSMPAPGASYDFAANKVLFIMQHPLGAPLKMTANIYRSLNANGTRVTYLNDTDNGSSGSPCLNANWELVALHHSGDPDTVKPRPEYNEGIPISAIVGLLQQRGKLGMI
jgi:hypothetical protein